ncbi:hypothetical protein [Corynebacterium cystitidis]|uniref:Uncharacterized protein n=1 Tax=Corynebacterium cystitidis DSM 20524 TaxID=1121357 RepID=A0A1H9QKT0_9CORY|nr:hypothetical protein [Corynebacterium cystitidis]WJY81746.1 hypothetical protein CCYS_03950 [Corynebacterium cystitidis DSM 20524]SER60795.1 hypothetical protein SAMN05661109_00576 [Corynebacterium cystitidis DSM 20524]SNV84091.1 Uncharacterised protein [Corynebacterium cystitidis]
MQDNSASMSNHPSRMRSENTIGDSAHSRRRSKRCGHFLDGHDIHHIRALRSVREGTTWEEATNIRLVDGIIEFDVGGQTKRGWNHDDNDVAWLIATGFPATWSEEFKLLRFTHNNSGYLLGVGRTADPEGCTSDRSDGGLIDSSAGNLTELVYGLIEAAERSQAHKEREALAMELLAGIDREE